MGGGGKRGGRPQTLENDTSMSWLVEAFVESDVIHESLCVSNPPYDERRTSREVLVGVKPCVV